MLAALASFVLACDDTSGRDGTAVPIGPPIRLMEPVEAQPGLHRATVRLHRPGDPEEARRPPDFLRGGIALAANKPAVRRLAEIPMFLPGDTSGRDSRAALLAPSGSFLRFGLDVPPNAELRTAVGYAILPRDVGRVVRFRARVIPIPAVVQDGRPAVVDYIAPETWLFDEHITVRADGSWKPLAADLSSWAGEQITLELRVDEEPQEGREARTMPVWAGWAAPEIVERDTRQEGIDLLWISLDTLRADRLGTYGYQRRATSPHLDRFAENGVVFETAISQAPWTRPSHRSMFTGNYPSSNRGFRNRLLALTLWRSGWRSAALTGGGQVDARMGFHPGFETYRVQYWHDDPGAVTSWYEANHGRRTFLFLHTFAVHDPYTDHRFARAESLAPGRIGEHFGRDEWDDWDRRLTDDEQAYIDALYDGGIAALDEALGRLFGRLKASGRLDHTLVVITSDHGEQLFEHGGWRHGSTMYDHQILVPAILHLPPGLGDRLGDTPARIADQIQLVDLYPTVLELLGLPLDHKVQGRSLVPLLRGETLEPRTAFSENVNIDVYERKAFRTKRWKLVWQTPKGSSAERAGEAVELFDLSRDPLERLDVSHQHPEAVVEQMKRMQRLVKGGSTLDEGAPDDLPLDLRERLRSLGYID